MVAGACRLRFVKKKLKRKKDTQYNHVYISSKEIRLRKLHIVHGRSSVTHLTCVAKKTDEYVDKYIRTHEIKVHFSSSKKQKIIVYATTERKRVQKMLNRVALKRRTKISNARYCSVNPHSSTNFIVCTLKTNVQRRISGRLLRIWLPYFCLYIIRSTLHIHRYRKARPLDVVEGKRKVVR